MQPSTREMKRPIMRFMMASGSMTTIYVTFHRVVVAKEAAGRVAQTFLQGLTKREKGFDFAAIRTRIIREVAIKKTPGNWGHKTVTV